MTTCEEAKQMRSGINIQAKIVDKGEVRTVNTKFGETKVCDAYLEDESGRIKLTLWADDTEKVKNGDEVSLEGGYTTTFRNEVQLNKGRKDGKLEVLVVTVLKHNYYFLIFYLLFINWILRNIVDDILLPYRIFPQV